jgi:long-subunit fatty acid transport protein
MKTLLSIAFIPIIFFCNIQYLKAQYFSNRSAYDLGPNWDFYASNYLTGPSAGKGNTVIASLDNGVSGVSYNPATLNVKNKFEFCIQGNYKFKISPYPPNVLPQDKFEFKFPSISAAFGYKINPHIQIGLYYSNPYSMENILTTYYTGNTPYDFNNALDISVHTLGIPFKIIYKNLHFGLSGEINYFEAKNIYLPSSHTLGLSNAWSINFKMGLIYEIPKIFNFGFSLSPPQSLNLISQTYEPNEIESANDAPDYPFKFSFGAEYQLPAIPVKISADFNLGSYKRRYIDNTYDFNIGTEYKCSNDLVLRLGMFTLNTNDQEFVGFNQIFLTAGAGIKIKDFNINAAILDSHISAHFIKNTIFQTSVAYGF